MVERHFQSVTGITHHDYVCSFWALKVVSQIRLVDSGSTSTRLCEYYVGELRDTSFLGGLVFLAIVASIKIINNQFERLKQNNALQMAD